MIPVWLGVACTVDEAPLEEDVGPVEVPAPAPEPPPTAPLPRDVVYVHVPGAAQAYTVTSTGEVRTHGPVSLLDLERNRILAFDDGSLTVRSELDGTGRTLGAHMIPEQLLVTHDGAVLAATRKGDLVQVDPQWKVLDWPLPMRLGTALTGEASRAAWWAGTDHAGRPCLRMPYRNMVGPSSPIFRPGVRGDGGDVLCWAGTRWNEHRGHATNAPRCSGCVPRDVVWSAGPMVAWRTESGSGARYTGIGALHAAEQPTDADLYHPATAGIPGLRPVGISPDGHWVVGCPMPPELPESPSAPPPDCVLVDTAALAAIPRPLGTGRSRRPPQIPVSFDVDVNHLQPVPRVGEPTLRP